VSLALAIAAFFLTSLFLHGAYLRYVWLLISVAAAARQVGRHAVSEQPDE